MKLKSLQVRDFGGLRRDRTLDFDGKSAVVIGDNEAGKTSFIDALRAALFPLPAARKVRDLFAVRYGKRGLSASAELIGSDGAVRTSSVEKPTGDKDVTRELFVSLFVLRGGECSFVGREKEETGLMAQFTKAVLGAGAVNLEKALNLLQVVNKSGNNNWSNAAIEVQQKLAEAEQRALALKDLRDAQLEADAACGDIARLQAEVEDAKEKLAFAGAALERLRAEDLKDGRAAWEAALRDEESLRLPAGAVDQAALERLAGSKAEAESEVSSLGGRLKDRTTDASRSEEALASARAGKARLADPARRKILRDALDAWKAAEDAVAQARPGAAPLEWIGAALVAVIGALAGWFIKPWAAMAGFAVGAVVGWVAGRMLKGPGSAANEEKREKLRKDFVAEAETLKWPTDTDAVRRKLAEEEEKDRTFDGQIEAEGRSAEQAKADCRAIQGKLSDAKDGVETSARALADGLRACGVSTLAAFIERRTKWQSCKDAAEGKRLDLCKGVGLPADADEVGLKNRLQRRITELQEAAKELPADWRELEKEEVEERCRELTVLLEGLESRLTERSREGTGANGRVERLKGSTGGDELSILRGLEKCKAAVDDLAQWRKAGEFAFKTVSALSGNTAKQLVAVADDASPIFAELMGGRYKGIELSGSVFDEGSLKVVLLNGETRVLDWLSSGAGDILWLSLRIALARRIHSEGGLLVLDEPFLTLDPVRTQAAFEALFSAKRLKDWQVLVLTKDPGLKTLAAAKGIKVLELGASEKR